MTQNTRWCSCIGVCVLLSAAALLMLVTAWHGSSAESVPDVFHPNASQIRMASSSIHPVTNLVLPLDHTADHLFAPPEQAYRPGTLANSCQQLLENTALNVIGGSIEPWEIFQPMVYYSTQNYVSPQYSLVLPDTDTGDPSPMQDAFGQIFDMPSNLTSVTIGYHTATTNANPVDKAFGNLWTVDNNNQLVDFLGGWEIADSPNAWAERGVLIEDNAYLAPMAGQRLAILLFTDTDGQSPGEAVYFDDITLTACTGATQPATATPTSSRTPTITSTATSTRTPSRTSTITPTATATPTSTLRKFYLPLVIRKVLLPTATPTATQPWCDLYEPNDTMATAFGPLVASQTYQARLCQGDQEDNYKLNARGGTPLVVTITLPTRLVNHTLFYIYHESNLNQPLPNPDCHRGPISTSNETITCPIALDGRYTLRMYTEDSNVYFENNQYYTLIAAFHPLVAGSTPTPTPTRTPTRTPTPTQVVASQTLYTIADATILEGYPSINLGTASDMWAGYDDGLNPNGRITRSLLRFDITSLPSNAVIQSATLRVYYMGYRDYPNRVNTITAYRINGSWTELGVTWNNKPGPGAAYGSVDIPANTNWGWRELDMQALVQGWVNGSIANQGVMLRGPEVSGADSSYRMFSTREGPYSPQLLINYVAAAAINAAPPDHVAAPAGVRLREVLGSSAAPADASGREHREMAP